LDSVIAHFVARATPVDDPQAYLRAAMACTSVRTPAPHSGCGRPRTCRSIRWPTSSNVYSGDYPTCYSAPGMPHDGYLADFPMRCKGFARD
jgi:hypothetical protein